MTAATVTAATMATAVAQPASWCVPDQRRRMICDYVNSHEWATVRELTEVFGISEATARRDLDDLVRQRRVVRVHGGAGRAGTAV
jgi:DeoR/GlpR family transcriptional regulator of sugar metabolism